LEDLLDGDSLASLSDRRFEDDTEGAISDNFLGVVREALDWLLALTILTFCCLSFDHLCLN